VTTRLPLSTYRLQLSPSFTFEDARRLLDYLQLLGISDLYAAPLTQGGPDMLNPYQITDHRQISPVLGGEQGLALLAAELAKRGMGLLCDLVPNHMCVSSEANQWWNDILENGPSSPYAHFFDIDWDPPRKELKNQVLLPVLSDQFGRVLENGDIQVVWQEGSFQATYGGRHFPLNPHTWVEIIQPIVTAVEPLFEPGDPVLFELESILTALNHLPAATEKDPERVAERHREKQIIKQRLTTLLEASKEVCDGMGQVLNQLNGEIGEPRSFDALERLLEKQCYRMSFWRVANHEINYRRFFDINDLAGLRVEEFEVFLQVHELVFRLVRNGWISGLRIDHVDGLFDPEKYLQELQQGCAIALASEPTAKEELFYVIVEKIFTGTERLTSTWPVHGTTGYDFLNLVNGLFIQSESRGRIEQTYRNFGGWQQEPELLIYSCKREALGVALAAEWHVLARHLDRVSEQGRYSRDFTLQNLEEALRELIACFPVYRSYVRPAERIVTDEDRRYVSTAVHRARWLNPTASPLIYDFIRSIVLLQEPPSLTEEQLALRHIFTVRFQQLTAPVMAKGVEDTAYYRSYALCSTNEVGADPYSFGASLETFHRENARRLKYWPHSLLATSTHDTKRSEDVRARLNVLSEIPDEWERAIWRWRLLNSPIKKDLDRERVPDGNEEYLFYQTVVGSWPLNGSSLTGFTERIQHYMGKATKEAKVHTSWINPNETYDQALSDFVRGALEPQTPFILDLQAFLLRVTRPGLYNSLSQLVAKIASPGVPDFYQGCELWDFSLVDPDNRRAVNFSLRRKLLDELLSAPQGNQTSLVKELLLRAEDGRIKLYVTAKALAVRREHAAVLREGAYSSVDADGSRAHQVIAFSRQLGQAAVVACVGRFFTQFEAEPVGEAWGDSSIQLSTGRYREVFTGQSWECAGKLACADLFNHLPVALLIKE
jgi:(1->4)-alpha-D-glucan 1-alpha-D-glucosylmutase